MKRGALLYDLAMSAYKGKHGKGGGQLLKLLWRQCREFREQDRAEGRPGNHNEPPLDVVADKGWA